MKICHKVLSCCFLFLGQEIFSSVSAGTGSLIRSGAGRSIGSMTNSVIPTITSGQMISKRGMMDKRSIFEPVDIPESQLMQYKKAYKEALDWANQHLERPIEFKFPLKKIEKDKFEIQTPLTYHQKYTSSAGKLVDVGESKAFLDLQLVNILKNKTIDSTTFWANMMALAALLGFYKVVDFLNNLYENNTILMWAVEADNENIVEFLLKMGVDIHKKNSNGDTAMLLAARYGNEKIIEVFINAIQEKYEDDPEKAKEEIAKLINTKNKDGRTAFFDVVEYGNFLEGEEFANPVEYGRINIIKKFINNGADITVQDNNGDNVLFVLAKKMDGLEKNSTMILQELFDIFVQKEPSMLQVSNKKGLNLLLLSLSGKTNLYLFNYLQDKIIDIMQQDNQGQNIVFKALISNNNSIIKAVLNLLKNKGINIVKALEIRDKNNHTVLDKALMMKASLSIIKLLVENGAQPADYQLRYAIKNHNIDIVKLFLSNSKLSPSANDLLIAFNTKNTEMLKVLLNSKYLSAEIKNQFIKPALLESLNQQNAEMFNLLFSMTNLGTKESFIKNILDTGNPAIINDFLNSSQVTDDMRKNMLEKAISHSVSAETLDTLLHNPKAEKAYRDPILRSLFLREALRNVNTGIAGVMSSKSTITRNDLKKDARLNVLLSAWEPKYEADKLNNWVLDKWSSLRGQKNSKEIFEDNLKSHEKELAAIIADENDRRKKQLMLDTHYASKESDKSNSEEYIYDINKD